jgi:hypothetical protein
LGKTLACSSDEEGGNFLVQMIFRVFATRGGGGSRRPVPFPDIS